MRRSHKTTDLKAVREATAELHRGTRLVASARQKLANATKQGGPHVVVAASVRWAHELLRAREATLRRYPGVAGFGLGRVIKDGTPTGDMCVTIFVRKKLTQAELRKRKWRSLPRWLSDGSRRIHVDIIEIGEIERFTFIGASLGPANDPHRYEGTIGAFAKDGVTGHAVAITAMHVSGMKLFPSGAATCQFDVPSLRLNDPNTRRLGMLSFGTMTGVDAAKIALDNEADAVSVIPELGEVQGWRPVAVPSDEGIAVAMYGAVSKLARGRVIHPEVALPQDDLDSAIIVDIAAQSGDSGAALVDAQNHVIGFLVGQATSGPYAGKCIFCPAAAVVDALNCDF
jgi:hypothetical protein